METARIYSNVHLGLDTTIGDFVVVGCPPRGHDDGQLATVIGDHSVVRSHSVVYAGNVIGARFQTGHDVMIRESNQIGDDVSIGTKTVVEHHVQIGDRVRIHSQAFIPEFSVLEEECWIGPNVVLTNAKYPRSPGVKEALKGPTVRHHAKIGANATLLPGVEVGAYALVGAGAVVVENVPPGCVVAGNPARVIKRVADLGVYHATAE
jgi:acetyltransferase-like isoleucine patch superfamily enzyme